LTNVVNLIGNTNTAGNNAAAPNNTDPYYSTPIGRGGGINTNGGHGRIIIIPIYNVCCSASDVPSILSISPP
jgi:hypothetical protein